MLIVTSHSGSMNVLYLVSFKGVFLSTLEIQILNALEFDSLFGTREEAKIHIFPYM